MKRLGFVIICMGMLCAYSAYAQVRTEEVVTTTDSTGQEKTERVVRVTKTEDLNRRTNMIVLNPLKFFFFYNLSYFHALNSNIALGGGLQIPAIGGFNGFGANAEMRFYPSKKALHGFYVAPNISFNSITYDAGIDDDPSTSVFSIGGLVGWQWFPGDDFALGLGIGVDYYTGSASAGDGEENYFGDYDGTAPAIRFDIGYAW